MKFGRIPVVLSIAFAGLVFATTASADSVKLTYEYQNQQFYLSVNGSKTYTALMCDAYDNKIYKGETWTATVTPFLQGIASSMFGPSMTLDYKAAGLIYKSMLSGSLSILQAQWAVWGLFSSNAQNNQLFSTYGGAATDASFLSLAQTAPNSSYAGLVLYTPLNAKPGSGPQEFIGGSPTPAVPEPGSLTLFGTGLLLLALAIRHKYART
jgi:hypothetical protein